MKAPVSTPPTGRVAPRGSARPRGKVPGGKALARLNMMLAMRGIAPEPKPPEPPALPDVPTPEPAPGAVPEPASAAAAIVAGYHAVRHQLAAAAAAPLGAPPLGASRSWQPLGPYFMPHGQSYGTGIGSRPPVAGRVSAIAVDPRDDLHVLCGSAGGGVWETRDGGLTWTPRTDDQPSLAIGALAFDPSDPRRVYCGTGEGNSAESPNRNVRAAGLLVSDDAGATWAVLPGATFVGISFYDLVVDPTNGDHLLAATTSGLWESTDRGATWARRRAGLVWSLSMHPPVPTNPAASREVLAGCADGVWRSVDGGRTWAAVAMPGTPAGFQANRIAVDHAPGNGSVAYAYAAGPPNVVDTLATEESGQTVRMPKPYLWRRETFGGAFASVRPPPDIQTAQAWYDWFLAVAPNNPDAVYLGAINAHRGERQDDGAWVWTNISAKRPTGDSIHPDQHAIAFGPTDPNVVYIGSDGGLFRSPDAGQQWKSLNKGMCITEIEFLAQHPEYDAWLLAGTQDNGTIRYEGQQVWYHVADGDGGDCAVDADEPYVCYHSYYGPYVERSDGGGAWNDWKAATPKALNDEDALFYPPLDVNGKLVVRGATQVWVSRDGGAHWRAVPIGAEGFPSAVTAATADRIYVGTDGGEAFRLDRAGASWHVAALTTPAQGYMTEILVDPVTPTVLWCAVNSGGRGTVYRSADGGATWTAVRAGLPDVAVNALEIDPTAPDTLFAATDVGVSRTDDGGATWTSFGRGLPNVLVKDVLLHPRTRLLRAGTQARGVWEIPVDATPTPDVQVYVRDHAADTGRVLPSVVDVPNPFAKGTNLFWWQSPDVKIDASPFRTSRLDDLQFDVYSDDRSKVDEQGVQFAAGLLDERPARGQSVRVYVQVHNRGRLAAQQVAVRVFFVGGSATLPGLPNGFWTAFPSNVVPAAAPWQPVAPHRVIDRIESGRSAVVGFDWSVPMTIGSAVALLAIVSAGNDPITAGSLDVGDLVRNSRQCALRNLAVINPPAVVGPKSHALVLDLWPSGAASLTLDAAARALVRGVVMSKALGAAAKKAGWKSLATTKLDAAHLTQATDARPALKQQLDLRRAYVPTAKAFTLDLAALAMPGPEPVIVLLKRGARRGAGSLVARMPGGAPSGGLTIVNLAGES
ncbi:hypothetical protein J421_4786 (plasmid) [Gemmatirosa kalamazoonensis]|uniref:Sortilin N-terminal domain-containing protein n=1 Tax=Gemmatirosa kalamazoonensis TaxID=861299 RepID=W0RNK4_9BACT|nr:hypothetical protein [Gemmatirosa kalamazoonensis]AHG92321.1 hypothetical protein J421_4786 [Gemmatirosa kalamazoonensis]